MQTNLAVIRRRFEATIAELPLKVGMEILRFTADRFRYQNWIEHYPVNWQRRSRRKTWTKRGKAPNNTGRAILAKSGRLRRGNRIVNVTRNSVTTGNDTPWARAHNDGLRMRFTQNVKPFIRINKRRDVFAAVAVKSGKKSSRIRFTQTASGISHVKAHTRKYNYKMPRRRFMGDSPVLRQQIRRIINSQMTKITKT